MSEEEELNIKKIMEQSVTFQSESLLLRDIYRQWKHGTILTDRQTRAFIVDLNRLQAKAWTKHQLSCECGRHNIIYVSIRVLNNVQTFTRQDNVQFALRRGNVMRLPLANAVVLVLRRYADFKITTALELSELSSPSALHPILKQSRSRRRHEHS